MILNEAIWCCDQLKLEGEIGQHCTPEVCGSGDGDGVADSL